MKKTRIMIKIGMGLVLLGLVFSANAQFKSGVEAVGRMESYTMKTTWDADTQTMFRYTDMRLRPWFGIMGHKDPQSLIFEDDIAGMKYSGRYNQLYFDSAYYIPKDESEKGVGGAACGFAERLFNIDASYKITPDVTAGLYGLADRNGDLFELEDKSIRKNDA